MIQIENNAKMQRAIERAKAGKLFVRATVQYRKYVVINRETGSTHTVEFQNLNGTKLASCSCKAGQASMLCYHVAGAVSLHLYLARVRG